ncbi:MAG TPA: tetratricopeptide repeat protein, partial [Polyangiaceae bacterium]|nr:tetratricopeptide repeat protein [Polyangiaceae bacterium]
MRTRRPSFVLGLCAALSGVVSALPASAQAPKPAASAAATSNATSSGVSASSSATTAGPSSNVDTSASAAPKPKKGAPPSPPPTAAQLKAFGILQQEAADYEKGTKDFRRNLTMIVRHHYEERRKRVLSALDRELSVEKRGLDESRDEAILRLEEFVARYSGSNADPRATPDAMFRLGALYEEKARAKTYSDLSTGLDPAIGMYRRIIKEFPQYEEIAAVHYYLGHSYTDAGRIEEGQQAWRTLVCSSRYSVQNDPKDAGKILLQPMPQDHDDKFWNDWYNKNPVPLDQAKVKRGVVKRGADKLVDTEELTFADPYDGCKPLPQKVEPGEDPRYLAEIWWQLGNFHFDQIDPRGGPYNLNRAVVAYQQSMQYTKPPIYGVSLYKLAWTYFKQQRYHTAVDNFVKLLGYADEQEAKTGDPGADFRQ